MSFEGRRRREWLFTFREVCHNGGKPFASSLTAASSGSKMAIMAPSGGPLKLPVCRGKAAGSAVQALWGQQWTRLASSSQRSTATTGAWPSPAHHGVGLARGPRWRSCPFRRSPETAGVQGKSRESAGSVPPFGGTNGLVCLTELHRSTQGKAEQRPNPPQNAERQREGGQTP